MRSSLGIVCVILCACVSIDSPEADPDEVEAYEAATRRSEAEPSDWSEVGRSQQGRPIRSRVLGIGPRRVLWIGGIHGNEREGRVATERLAAAFLTTPDLAELVTLTIVEDINPDGSAANRRGNARGVDLNRNFPAKNRPPGSPALTEVEARVLHDLILDLRPDTVIVVHSWGIKPRGPRQFINFDGPAEFLARTFATINPDYPVKDSRYLPPTPGSLGSWVGIDMQIPILTLEYMRGRDPDEAWAETRVSILAVIRG